MRYVARALLPAVLARGPAVYPVVAEALHKGDPQSRNIHAIGESLRPGGVTDPVGWDTRNTDLAFWGRVAIQGRYDGFRVIDISAPGNPRELAYFQCVSDQGDVGVWGNLVFRSVNSGTRTDGCTGFLDAQTPGFEGIQIFDISNLQDIRRVASVPLDCGSHTHTVVPDLRNNRVLIYNSTSQANTVAPSAFGNRCTPTHNRFDIVEVLLDDPQSARVIGSAELGTTSDGRPIRSCHDIGVIQGTVNRAACAGNPHTVVFDISDPAHPVRLFSVTSPTVTSFHSAAFTFDGRVLALGWEPGGGTRPRCQATGAIDPGTSPLPADDVVVTDEMKSAFFHDAETGVLLGRWILPRPQSVTENCTVHNYNIVPHRDRYLLVHGSYQSGTSMVDFTDPANAYEVAYSDPPPLDTAVHPRGGAWSTYYYNNFIYESDTTRGLRVYRVSDRVTGGALRLPYLNPQTSDFSLP